MLPPPTLSALRYRKGFAKSVPQPQLDSTYLQYVYCTVAPRLAEQQKPYRKPAAKRNIPETVMILPDSLCADRRFMLSAPVTHARDPLSHSPPKQPVRRVATYFSLPMPKGGKELEL